MKDLDEGEIFNSDKNKAIFLTAFAVVKMNKDSLDRLEYFYKLYGFCRNIAFSALVASVMIFAFGSIKIKPWGWGLLLTSLIMYFRYLKFLRQYAHDLFLSFIEISKEVSPRA
jgi:Ca2+/Na+ antiporter